MEDILTLKYASRLALVVMLSGCGGGEEPAADTPVDSKSVPVSSDDPASQTPAAPAADDNGPDAVRSRSLKVMRELASLTKVEAEAESGGDLARTVVGYKRGDALVVIVDVQDVGEYGRTELTYVLDGGKPVFRAREGFSHDPIEGQDSRFKAFEEQVVLGDGGKVVEARERAVFVEGHPTESTALPAGWEPVAEVEPVEVAELTALFD